MSTADPAAGVVVRDMSWRDIDRLTALECELFPDDAWAAATWWAELALRPRRRYAVAEVGRDLGGYAGLDATGEIADVMTVGVAARLQGRGLGRVLLDWLVGQAEASGAAYLMLEVRADNAAARTLYDHNGFEVLRVRRGYYQPGGVDAVVMRRRLGAG